MRASGQPSAPARAGVVLATLILAAGIANINLAVANVAMPDIGQAFKASQTAIDLIAVGYSLGLAASVLYLGAIGDRYGRKLAPFAAFVVDAARAGETTWRNPTQYHLHGHPATGRGAALPLVSSSASCSRPRSSPPPQWAQPWAGRAPVA